MRKNAIGQDDTFAPQLVARKGPNSGSVKHPDALDRLANEVNLPSNDIMEQPLAAQKKKQSPFPNESNEFNGLPSPNSDSLGKELKKFGSKITDNSPNAQPQYKSKFLQQFDQPPPNKRETSSTNVQVGESNKQPIPDEEFLTMLRSSDKRSSGPGWNNDTAADGFAPVKRVGGSNSRITQNKQAKLPLNDNNREVNLQDFRGGFPKSGGHDGSRIVDESMYPNDDNTRNRSAVQISPRMSDNSDRKNQVIMTRSAGGDPAIGQARSNLSLLKNKIRQSENFNSSRPLRKTLSAIETTNEMPEPIQSSSASKQYEPYVPNSRTTTNQYSRNTQNGGTTRPQNNNFDNSEADEDVEVIVPRNRNRNPGIASTTHNPPQTQQQQQQQYDSFSSGSNKNNNNNSNNNNRPPSGRQQQQNNDSYSDQSSYNPNISKPPVRNLQPTVPPRKQVQQEADEDDDEYDNGNPYANEQEEAVDENQEQMQCPDCGRKFNPIPYTKHVKICAKVFMKKRKAFDSAKMRIQDNPELVQIIAKTKKEEMKQSKKPKRPPQQEEVPIENTGAPKWKNQSQAFREAMRAARECGKAQAAGAPLPPPKPSAPDPSLILCQHCGRRFNEKAAERHIPQCQNIKAKPTVLKRGSGVGAASGGTVKPKR